jgi:hypothetical protein
MPLCDNNEVIEDESGIAKYKCNGHYLNSHGDPYRDFRFWVYPPTVHPFNLGKGDYVAKQITDVCTHYR